MHAVSRHVDGFVADRLGWEVSAGRNFEFKFNITTTANLGTRVG